MFPRKDIKLGPLGLLLRHNGERDRVRLTVVCIHQGRVRVSLSPSALFQGRLTGDERNTCVCLPSGEEFPNGVCTGGDAAGAVQWTFKGLEHKSESIKRLVMWLAWLVYELAALESMAIRIADQMRAVFPKATVHRDENCVVMSFKTGPKQRGGVSVDMTDRRMVDVDFGPTWVFGPFLIDARGNRGVEERILKMPNGDQILCEESPYGAECTFNPYTDEQALISFAVGLAQIAANRLCVAREA